MKCRYKITISYDGSRYAGWQKLGDNPDTIQNIVEKAISETLTQDISIRGSGRTDAGVHSLGQTADFVTDRIEDTGDFISQVNCRLPEDIKITGMEKTNMSFHSRKSAVEKTYCYFADNSETKNVFKRKYLCVPAKHLDVENMQRCAQLFAGTHDFKAFSSKMEEGRGTVRTITNINVNQDKNGIVTISVTADGFLYNMVRIIAGTLMEAGEGTMTPEQIYKAFETKNRVYAGKTAPAKGLFLWSVKF